MQQRVEILKALYRKANILILDEPTGVLTPAEADQLFRILKRLREEGKTIILITHKLREIMDITDTVSVMRQGEMTATLETNKTSPENLAELMVGRKVLLRVDKSPAKPENPVLEIEDLNMFDDFGVQRLKNVSLSVRAGEILGGTGVDSVIITGSLIGCCTVRLDASGSTEEAADSITIGTISSGVIYGESGADTFNLSLIHI